MTVSVIIPTYNGAHKILTALRALGKQVQQPDEVIVVIDGSTDDTIEILSGNSFQFKSFRIVQQENKGRSEVRNTGAREAQSDLLVFMDDDMLPEPQWLAAHITHHELHPGSILTSAGIDTEDASHADFQKFKVSLSVRWKNDLKPFNKKVFPRDKVFITAANFSLFKEIFHRVGGFNPILNDVEDYDFAVRATQLDIPVYYDEDAYAFHIEKASCSNSIRRMRGYDEAREVLINTYPDLYQSLLGQRKIQTTGFRKAAFSFFCHRFWVDSIDKDFWTWLPKSVRYKLYDIVLTANSVVYPGKVRL